MYSKGSCSGRRSMRSMRRMPRRPNTRFKASSWPRPRANPGIQPRMDDVDVSRIDPGLGDEKIVVRHDLRDLRRRLHHTADRVEAQFQHGTVDGCDHLTPTQLYPHFSQTLPDLGPPDGNLAEFVQSESALRILSLGYFASAAAGPCGTALFMIGRERAYAGITFVALLGCIAANYLLAQDLGTLGPRLPRQAS